MFDRNTHLPPIFPNFNEPFTDSNSFISSSLPSFSFDTGSPFERLFPLSDDEPFANISFARLTSNDFNIPKKGVVHNIPIKIEGECDSSSPTSSAEPYFLPEESKNNNLLKSAANRPNCLPPSPPALPQRKYLNNSYPETPSLLTFNTFSNADDKKTRSSCSTSLPTVSKTLNRPALAPKPKIQNKEVNNDKKESNYDTPGGGDENVVKIAWRLAKLAAPLENQPHTPTWSRQKLKNLGFRDKDQENTNNLLKGLETLCSDDMGSSSPSSSGIVADGSDSALDYSQSSNNLSERDAAYDFPRVRSELFSKLGKSMSARSFQQPEKNQSFAASLSFNNSHYGTLNGNAHSLTPSLQSQPKNGSTSVLQNVLDGLDHHHDTGDVDGDSSSFGSVYSTALNQARRLPNTLSSTSAEMNRESTCSWKEKSPLDSKTTNGSLRNDWNSNGDIGTARKNTVCEKLSNNFRLLDMNIKRIEECTAPQAWRQPHILQRNLLDIKESMETVVSSLEQFLDASSHIAIDPASSKIEDLKRLINPLRNSYSLLSQLKQSIDNTGWTLSALVRPKNKAGVTVGNDALDQFVAVVKQVPVDSHKMLQWVSTLVPSNAIRFLISTPKEQHVPSYDAFGNSVQNLDVLKRNSDFDNSSEDSKRCSLTSTITVSSSSDIQMPAARGRLSFNSSNNNQGGFGTENISTTRNSVHGITNLFAGENNINLSAGNSESRVIEEDDLESVLSDRESLSQDYALVGDEVYSPVRKRPLTNGPPSIRLSSELTNTLSEDDRQLLRFYAPQLESHIDFLSRAIEEFLSIVEEQLPPHEFVQKGKLIILAAHKLIYIGDNIAQCISAPVLTAEAKKTADRLCCVLKNCVQATKNAADKYPDVSAVQAMVDSIVTVSHAAYDLKLLVNQCC